jgi:hypothetical protein
MQSESRRFQQWIVRVDGLSCFLVLTLRLSMPVDVGSVDLPHVMLTVNHTNPMWFYCQQQNPAPHCQKGMVFAINPPPEHDPHSFAAFKALAMGNVSTPSSTADDNWSTPPPQTWHTATATVSHEDSTWLTTYTSYEGTAGEFLYHFHRVSLVF